MSVFIFKPDEIGDFIISTGSIRALAERHGEENVTLAVKSEIAPLAQREFPAAKVIGIPWHAKRKGQNQALANLRSCFPVWRELRRLRVDDSVCLRSCRDYVQTLLFSAPSARRSIAPENMLLRKGAARRRLVEFALVRSTGVKLVPYPVKTGSMPKEISSHRDVVAEALGREVSEDEVTPSFRFSQWHGGSGWLLCPFSSRLSKDYDAARWASALGVAIRSATPPPILLAGSPDQAGRLQKFADDLAAPGFPHPVKVMQPSPLREFPDVVSAADLVLTVDTAAAHFACALGTPAVIVDSGKNPGTYGPYSRNGKQLWLVADRARLGRSRWQESVPPQMVADAIKRALAA
ncbi:MAG: glycosyltransferase family 9 protein [Chthoniobacterales bacterium]